MNIKRCLVALTVALSFCLAGFAQPVAKNPTAGTKKMNIFALVSKNLEEHALDVSRALKEQEGLETFPQLGFQVHATLYMTHFDEANVEKVKELVASFAAGVKAFPQKTAGLQVTKDNWLFINLEKNHNLQTLSDSLVEVLSPLRSAEQQVPSWLSSYPEKAEYFKKYGSPNVFAQFEPHLTLLAKTEGESVPRFVEKNKDNKKIASVQDGQVIGIGLAIADGAGQIKEKLATYLFK